MKTEKANLTIAEEQPKKPECFVIMPISNPDGYCSGHFERVYKDIFKPAIEEAGFMPFRVDDSRSSNLIQLDIIRKLIECPMAICDLSSRNPNVLFELGIRQAFDKPVTLVQEEGTPQIFDISQIRYTTYRKERIYHEVIEDQRLITEAITSTFKDYHDGKSVNSIVKLLQLTSGPARLDEAKLPKDPAIQYIMSELTAIRSELGRRANISEKFYPSTRVAEAQNKLARHHEMLESLIKDRYIPRIFLEELVTNHNRLMHESAKTDNKELNEISQKYSTLIAIAKDLQRTFRENTEEQNETK